MEIKAKRLLITIIITLCFFYLIASLLFKPIICNDAISGMVSLHNYLQDGAWNKILNLTADNRHIYLSELTWWAPGQYELPYLLSKLCFINIGAATTLFMFLSVCGGCYFYYRIFKIAGLSAIIILIALIILLLQRFVSIYFLQYNSSDLFLFFYTPFYLFVYHKFTRNYRNQLAFKLIALTALNYLGLFVKNSFVLFEISFNFFIVAEFFLSSRSAQKTDDGNIFRLSTFKKLLILLPFILSNLFNYYFFLRLGDNPTLSYGMLISLPNVLAGIFLSVIETLFGNLSVAGMYGNVLEKVPLASTTTNVLMIIILLIIGYLIYFYKIPIINLFKHDILFRFTIVAGLAYVFFWLIFTLRQSAISYEDRLFLPVTILILPYLLNAVHRAIGWVKYCYYGLISVSIVYGVCSFGYRVKKYTLSGSVISQNKMLNGFRVYSKYQSATPAISQLSNFINTKFADYYLFLTDPDFAFQLNVTNKFVIGKGPIVLKPANEKADKYLVLIQIEKDVRPVGLKMVYASQQFELYQAQ